MEYTLKRTPKSNPDVKPGTKVYPATCYDYGCANDDERTTGKEHLSVTLDPNGGYPFFTVPVEDLETDGPQPAF